MTKSHRVQSVAFQCHEPKRPCQSESHVSDMSNTLFEENVSTKKVDLPTNSHSNFLEDQSRLRTINRRVQELGDTSLDNHVMFRKAQIHVAKSLAHSLDQDQISRALEMLNCGRELVKSVRQVDSRPLYRTQVRCKQRSCPRCSSLRGFKYTNMIAEAFKQLRFKFKDDCDQTHSQVSEHYKMIPLKLTLNGGSACELNELRPKIKSLHDNWSRLLRIKMVKENMIGALRSTEITESKTQGDSIKANPHIHGTILLRMNSDTNKIIAKIKKHWHKLTEKSLYKAGCTTPRQDSTQCVQDISLLQGHTFKDCISWIQYSTKGILKTGYSFDGTFGHQNSSVEFWLSVDKAVKHMRLISTYGYLKDSLMLVKEEMTRAKLEAITPPTIDPTEGKLIWSDRDESYIHEDLYNDSHDQVCPLSQSLDRTRSHPMFAQLFKAELDEASKRKCRRSLRKLLDTGNFDEFEQNANLILQYIKKCKSSVIAQIDPREAIEVERHLHRDPTKPSNRSKSKTDTSSNTDTGTALKNDLKTDQKTKKNSND